MDLKKKKSCDSAFSFNLDLFLSFIYDQTKKIKHVHCVIFE